MTISLVHDVCHEYLTRNRMLKTYYCLVRIGLHGFSISGFVGFRQGFEKGLVCKRLYNRAMYARGPTKQDWVETPSFAMWHVLCIRNLLKWINPRIQLESANDLGVIVL